MATKVEDVGVIYVNATSVQYVSTKALQSRVALRGPVIDVFISRILLIICWPKYFPDDVSTMCVWHRLCTYRKFRTNI